MRAKSFVRSEAERDEVPVEWRSDSDTFNILMVISRPGGPEGDVPFQSVARPLLVSFAIGNRFAGTGDLKVLQQNTGPAGVLSQDPGYGAQRFSGPAGDISQIADRGAYEIESSHPDTMGVRPGSVQRSEGKRPGTKARRPGAGFTSA